MISSLVAQLLPLALLLGGQGGTIQTPVVPVPSATLEEAVSMFHSGNHAQSVALLKRLQVGDLKAPEATAVKHLLGRNFVSLGHYDEAIESLLSALKDARRPGRTQLTDHLRWSLAQAYEGKG